ncbi:HK97 family phage prohead protease [Nitrobacter sp.]|uniref:HK97 family phage prohead protease n=1 Tax=unclassified Nitrobacter TaxID=2620411 RepID=UPI00321FDA48
MHAPLSSVSRLSFSGDGTVEGYASLFGEIDQARDMMMPGAFTQTLKTRGLRRIPMLFQHDPAEPVGVWLELHEDFRGLWARGKLIPDVTRARELFSLVEAGAVDGLSIGYRTVRGRIDPRTRVRHLYQVDLWEISIVTFPLLAGARVRAVKQATSLSPRSRVRTQAEREWRSMRQAADEPAPSLRPRPVVASLCGREARRAALQGTARAQLAGAR